MFKHQNDQLDIVRVQISRLRCSRGVPDKGRCDLEHGHLGIHRIHGQEVWREEFRQGAFRSNGEWALTATPSEKPVCSVCGRD